MKIVRWIVALVLAVAAGMKIGGAGGMDGGETMFGELPAWGRMAVVAAELAVASWLVSGWRPRWSAMAAIVLLSVFLAAILMELQKPEPRACGCFGVFAPMGMAAIRRGLWESLGADGALLACGVAAYLSAAGRVGDRG